MNITCNDLICMMLQIEISDPSLQRELGAVRNPTLAAFNEKIEGFEQARQTVSTNAYGNAISCSNAPSGRKNPGQSGRSANKNPALEEKEKETDRCARPDQMIPQCTYPESVKCNLCIAVGHVTPACSCRQSAQMAQHHQIPHHSSSSLQNSQQLAIAYDGDSHLSTDGSASAWPLPSSSSSTTSSHTRAGAFYTPSNLPTPEMPL